MAKSQAQLALENALKAIADKLKEKK